MLKQLFLILSGMVIVFALTLLGGDVVYILFISPNAGGDKYIQTAVSLVGLLGLASLLSGLVGLIGSVLLKAAEVQDTQQQSQIEMEPEGEKRP